MMTHLIDDGERRILLTDFGIARNVDDISGLTATNMTVGTASSYERCATRSRKSDYRFRIAIRKARTKPNGVSASAAPAPGHSRDMQCMALVGRHQVAQLAACRAPPFGGIRSSLQTEVSVGMAHVGVRTTRPGKQVESQRHEIRLAADSGLT
jgi:hypothetical protein